MGDHDEARARLALQPAQLRPGLRPQPGIERRQWLIEQQQRRLSRQRPGQCHALLLAAGKLGRAAGAEARKPHQRQQFLHPRQAEHPGTAQAIADILSHAEMRKQRIGLEHHGAGPCRGRQPGHVPPGDADAARIGRLKTRHQPQQRRFAGA